MIHAQDCDMMEWFWNDPEQANAFILANAGYDVWMGNNRGSKYSKGHLTLSPKDHAFWDFYQEDMARHDLPTFINYITEKTGRTKISYIGHSEGTTQMFLGASLMPEYFRDKINLYIALAPVASTANLPNPIIREAAKFIKIIEYEIVHKYNYYNWFAPMPVITDAVGAFCELLPGICEWVGAHLHNEDVDNGKRFPMFISNEPSGQSYRTFVYYAQMINSGECRLYDYGRLDNKKRYGTYDPPLVPLENI
jgi:gastric triacylglycerol lipase